MYKFLIVSVALLLAALSGRGQDGTQRLLPFTHFVMVDNTHLVLVDMDFVNDGIFDPGQGTVHFTGNSSDSLRGTAHSSFHNLVIDKGIGANFYIPPELPIDGPWSVRNDLVLGGSDNKIVLSIRDLVLGPEAAILGAGTQKFIATPGSGRVVKEALTDFTFPVGSDENRYNPLQVTSSGVEDIGVRCLPHVLANGDSGNPLSRGVVDVSWKLTKAQPSAASLTLTAQWNAGDERAGFNGNDCGVSQSLGNGDWNLAGANIGEKLGQGPFRMTRSGIQLLQTDSAVFAVGSEPLMYPLRIGMKTYLQGTFNTGTGLMDDQLRTLQLIPLAEPYSQIPGFTHVGRGGGEMVSENVLSVSGPEAIVDWVFVELRDGANSSTVLETHAALIRRDGTVVGVDGTSPVVFRGRESGSYYFDIRHRNHLGLRTPDAYTLYNDPVLIYDFSTEQANAYQGVQAFLGPNAGWGMYGGNANSNANVRYSGPGSDQNTLLNGCLGGNKALVLSKLYHACDLNLNGTVRYSGPLNEQNFLLNTVLGGDKTKVIAQPNF